MSTDSTAANPLNGGDLKTRLSSLPPAILDFITEYLSASDILQLCCTFSKSLLHRLQLGNARKFIAPAVAGMNITLSHFAMIKYLPSISVIELNSSAFNIWRAGPAVFELFPATLSSLSVTLPIQFNKWLHIAPKWPNRLGSPDSGARIAVEFSDRQIWAPKFYISRVLPLLNSLSIKLSFRSEQWISTLGIKTNAPFKNIVSDFVASLPDSLSHLMISRLDETSWNSLKILPPRLTSLMIGTSDIAIPTTALHSLPSSLASLELEFLSPSFSVNTSDMFKRLPANLTVLSWTQNTNPIETQALGELTNLTELNLVLPSITIDVEESPLSYLKNLSKLESLRVETSFVSPSDVLTWAELPQSLTKLRWRFLNGMPRFRLPGKDFCLPPNLTTLDVGPYCLFQEFHFARFPQTLTHLSIDLHPLCFECHVCNCRNCAPELCRTADGSSAIPYLKSIRDDVALLLPRSLKILNISGEMGTEFLQQLPSSITQLRFHSIQPLSDTALSILPMKLRTLNLDSTPKLNPEALRHLPKQLTHLSITAPTKVTDSIIEDLPESLIHLYIAGTRDLTDACAPHLPRRLDFCSLPQSIHFTVNCLPNLPRSLRQFYVFRIVVASPRPLKADVLRWVPPLLQAYNLPWKTAKNRSVDLHQFE